MLITQYTGVLNKVYFEGKVKKTFGDSSIVEVPKNKHIRGEEFKPAAIFAMHDKGYVKEGDKVFFQGELQKDGLRGKLYKNDSSNSAEKGDENNGKNS